MPQANSTPVSLLEAAAALPDLWSPHVIGTVRGPGETQFLKVVRVLGEFPWHEHQHEDELFLVLSGALIIGRAPADGGPVTLHPGQVFIVPRGLRHNTSATTETLIALFESASTAHTGAEQTPLTRSLADQLADPPPSPRDTPR